MRRKLGLLSAAVLVPIASVLCTAQYNSIVAQISNAKETVQSGFLKAQGGLFGGQAGLLGQQGGISLPGLPGKNTDAQEQALAVAKEEANRQKALLTLRESRAQAEAERKRAGDMTPTVEAIVAGPDNRLRALIGSAFVCEGDVADGYRIQKIDKDRVEFEKAGKVWVQKMQ